MTRSVDGPRARYRQQVRDEVQTRAWEQISRDGASALSLKAIATQMGMTAPALYRYYSSRDALLTELILSAYGDLAVVIEGATDDQRPPADRITDIAGALRRWAMAQPQRYLLLYGTPVPGYSAPEASTDLARRILAPILRAFQAISTDQEVTLRRSVTLWTRLHGVLSLQLAGHFVGMDVDTDQLFQSEVRSLLSG